MVGMFVKLTDMFGAVVGIRGIKLEETKRRLVVALTGVEHYNGLLHLAGQMILNDVDAKQRVQGLDIREEQ
jgi:hypothetical protein